MRKQIEVTHKYEETFCDKCGDQITTRFNLDACIICGIELCMKCQKVTGAHIERSGDGTVFTCAHCSSIYTIIYEKRLDALSTQIDTLQEQYESIYNDFIKTAKEHREQNETKIDMH